MERRVLAQARALAFIGLLMFAMAGLLLAGSHRASGEPPVTQLRVVTLPD